MNHKYKLGTWLHILDSPYPPAIGAIGLVLEVRPANSKSKPEFTKYYGTTYLVGLGGNLKCWVYDSQTVLEFE